MRSTTTQRLRMCSKGDRHASFLELFRGAQAVLASRPIEVIQSDASSQTSLSTLSSDIKSLAREAQFELLSLKTGILESKVRMKEYEVRCFELTRQCNDISFRRPTR